MELFMDIFISTTIVAFVSIAAILSITTVGGIIIESKDYNHGICKHCKAKLRYFDSDSHGGRGYICDECGFNTWISYNCVDKNHSEV